MDYTAANAAAESARLALADQQVLFAGRPENDLCRAVLAPAWSKGAPRCPNSVTHLVEYDDYRTGMLTMGEFTPAQSLTKVCDVHEEQVRHMPGWRYSRRM